VPREATTVFLIGAISTSLSTGTAQAGPANPEKEWNVKTLLKRLAISSATVGVLTSGMVMGATSEAMAAPCGLSHTTGDLPGGPLKVVYYDIRNCHNYKVKRKLDLAGTTDEPCLTIQAGQTVSRTRVIAGWAGVRGMKPC
jgi:hypothetical protein